MYSTLISVAQLQALQASGTPCKVFDCSFDLTQPQAGRAMYEDRHIAGAVYADLNTDLSAKGDPHATGAQSGGRHPLPSREHFALWLHSMGFDDGAATLIREQINRMRRMVPQQVIGPTSGLTQGIHIGAAEKVSLDIHLLNVELTGLDLLMNPLV